MTKKLYYYNIHDIIRVRSQQRLPELGYFLTNVPQNQPDIDVHIVGDPARYRQADSISYDEPLGSWGFSIVINRSETRTDVYATPTISRSPHVLYTNVVEPLFRWLFVRKGYAMMHGACLSFNGEAIFVTAQTDTGKTTTILHTIRHTNRQAQFISDDMTIFSRDGQVMNYPKPLTISQHTVQAVGGAPLSLWERTFLKVQSRLHSRGGRRFGLLLSQTWMPAATLNAWVQMVIPPPKYMVHRLIPGTRYADRAKLSHIVLIERGPDYEGAIPEGKRAPMLIANAEDAYGFPPYPILADQLSHWQGQDLHEAELAVVQEAIAGLPGTHIRSPRYDWYKRIPQLVNVFPQPETPAAAARPAQGMVPGALPTD